MLSGGISTHEKFYFSIHDGRRAILRESCCRAFFAEALKAPVPDPTDSRGPWLRRSRHRIAALCEIDTAERSLLSCRAGAQDLYCGQFSR